MGFLQALKASFFGPPGDDGSKVKAKAGTTVSARVFRADGTVEDLGVVSRNGRPVKRVR